MRGKRLDLFCQFHQLPHKTDPAIVSRDRLLSAFLFFELSRWGLKTTQKSLHQHQKACIRSQRCRWDTNIMFYTGGIDTAEVEVQIPNSNPRMGTHLHFSFGASGLKIHTSSTFHPLKLLQNASKTVFATPPPVSIKFSICLKGQRHK